MKRWICTGLVLAGCHGAWAAGAAVMVDGVVAVVNDRVITYSEVMEYVRPLLANLRRNTRGDEFFAKLQQTQRAALEDLIDQALILDEFQQKGFSMPENLTDNYINSLIERDYGGDREAFLKSLEAQGLPLSRFREQIRDRHIIQAMHGRQTERNIVISPYRIEKYYQDNQDKFRVGDQIRLRMIVIRRDPAAPATPVEDQRQQLATKIWEQLEAGADFENLAREYSQGKEAAQGGDWGWIGRDVLRQELNEVAFQLPPHTHSPVITTDDGYYILQVDEVKPAHVKPLAEVRSEIEVTLLQEQRAKMQQDWIKQLRAKAYIRIF